MYYAYKHTRLDTNEIFYIGIGKKNPKRMKTFRSTYSRAFSKTSRNVIWKNIVKKAGYKVDIIYECSSENSIIKKEIELIKVYGKIIENSGILCNITDGGHGIQSFKHSSESKKIISEFSKKRIRRKGYKLNISDEGRKSISEAVKNRSVSEDTKIKMSNNLIGNKRGVGHKISKEHRDKLNKATQKAITQFDMLGNLIARYDSPIYVRIKYKECESRGIKRCCDGKTKSYKNYIWKYEKDTL